MGIILSKLYPDVRNKVLKTQYYSLGFIVTPVNSHIGSPAGGIHITSSTVHTLEEISSFTGKTIEELKTFIKI